MKTVNTPLCSFCKIENETTKHAFSQCDTTRRLWKDLNNWLSDAFQLPLLCPQSALIALCRNNFDN